MSLICNTTLASCNWSEDVRKNQDGSFSYSRGCHVEVGASLEELDLRRRQVDELKKSVELKDLAISYSEQRTQLWIDSSIKMNERLNQHEATRANSGWIYFGVGVAVTVLSVWAAGQLK
jgi:hypothetical protein